MTFWSDTKIIAQNATSQLISDFDPKKLNCANYPLSVGEEVFITPNHEEPKPSHKTKQKLSDGEAVPIPSGQFGFILTEEEVNIPNDAIALISMKSKSAKFKGLINVSGFHVDPGYKGKLVFAVFNAGPQSVHLQRGAELFSIWFADLDQTNASTYAKSPANQIAPDLMNGISGELPSVFGLSNQVKDFERKLSDRIHALENKISRFLLIAMIALVVVVYPSGRRIYDAYLNEEKKVEPVTIEQPKSQIDTQITEKKSGLVTMPKSNEEKK